MGKYNKSGLIITLLMFAISPLVPAETTQINAVIADDIGCEMQLAENTLHFTPQRVSSFQGSPTAYEIKPLRTLLVCVDKTGVLTPKLTVQGNTPYNESTVFLDGTPNSAGFMLRLSDGTPLSLTDFYNTDKAIKRGAQILLTPLNAENHHYHEEVFLIGLVGPMDGKAVPGEFSAALTFNLIFQ